MQQIADQHARYGTRLANSASGQSIWVGTPPFRHVAAKAERIHEEVFPAVASKDRKDWVGTVHTMQGKEADAVVLVLGGDPRKPGARRFATESPNLLNVAASRAKRRLYVIGDRTTWGHEGCLTTLAAWLPASLKASGRRHPS